MKAIQHLASCLLVGLSGAFYGCAHPHSAPVVPQASPKEVIAIYSVVIHDMYLVPWSEYRHRPLKQLVVADSTPILHGFEFDVILRDTARFRTYVHSKIPEMPPELFSCFIATNATRTAVVLSATVDGVPVRLLSRAAIKAAFTPGPEDIPDSLKTFDQIVHDRLKGWAPFYRRYPDSQGILDVSRVCVDQTQQWAFLYVGNQFAGLGGSGYLVAVQRVGETWQIRAKIGLWQS